MLRYGIPDFKMEKHVIDRRLEQMAAEGIEFVTNAQVGRNVAVEDLRSEFDAVVLAGGAEHPRDLDVPGRDLKGIHFAMDFLPQQNRRCARRHASTPKRDSGDRQARDHHRRRRHGRRLPGHLPSPEAASVHQFEIMPMPPDERSPQTPWPMWPMQLRIEGAHEEGGIREWSISTTHFTGDERRPCSTTARHPSRRAAKI